MSLLAYKHHHSCGTIEITTDDDNDGTVIVRSPSKVVVGKQRVSSAKKAATVSSKQPKPAPAASKRLAPPPIFGPGSPKVMPPVALPWETLPGDGDSDDDLEMDQFDSFNSDDLFDELDK